MCIAAPTISATAKQQSCSQSADFKDWQTDCGNLVIGDCMERSTKSSSAPSRARTALALCVAIFSVSILGCVVYKYTYAPRLAQRQEQSKSLVKLFGPGGRNVRKAGQMVDTMHLTFFDRMKQLEADCNKKRIPDAERSRLIQATLDANKAAMDKVVASRYQAPFEPHYPSLP